MLVDGAVHEGRGVISSQVCQEFCNVMLHKLTVPIPRRDLEVYLESTVYPLIRVLPSPRLFAEALTVHQQPAPRFPSSNWVRPFGLIFSSAILELLMRDDWTLSD